jgi:hypothetical protein
MSQYLTTDAADAGFFPPGVTPDVSMIIRASALIDGYCKRSIGVKSYTERIRLTDTQRGHLTYAPVVQVEAAMGRPQYGIMGSFFGPPPFEDIADLGTLDVDPSTGSLVCGYSMFGSAYVELEVTYTSGWDPIPDNVKTASGMLMAQLSSNPNANVKSKKDFDYTIEYFGASMVTPEVAGLLSEYVLMTFR